MHSFCTLFDSNYLTRGLAMYESLKATDENFVLYVVCFDDLAYECLEKCGLPNLIAISLKEFESDDLLGIKGSRSVGEYCWTCTPHVIRYVLDTYNLQELTYLDADLYFFANPVVLLDEFHSSGASVLIIPHRYTPRYDQSATSGVYCVQFMTFKANEQGLTVLQWWQDRCIEWCYNRFEDGKFGDQKYLDDWTERFEGVHVLQHIGGGVAPWNIQQYTLNEQGGCLYVDNSALVFYHYHAYKYYKDGPHDLGGYQLKKNVIPLVYHPYVEALKAATARVRQVIPDFDRGYAIRHKSWKTPLRNLRRRLKREFNEYRFI